ncbi:putative bifunctional diguanylate cyclase/phosphodiesterase [Pseudidiomarina salilacus]|uniref:putative bifunctional diguanylate cyclase/phosphodiesterase n=1 Tax=Pseudidiomarina salilacus TaxID=3384452 RepID=UPI003984CFB3
MVTDFPKTATAYQLADIHFLRAHYERWQTIYELAPVGVSIADEAGQIIDANPAAERILRLSKDQHLSATIHDSQWEILDALGQHLQPEHYASAIALREQRVVENQIMQVRHRQGMAWLTVSAAPLPTGGVIIVYADITEVKEQAQRIAYLSAHDQLTGIANRTAFFGQLEQRIVATAKNEQVAVLVLDIDGFKEFNESAGHETGDKILQEVAKRIASAAPPASFVARIGGDEFAVTCSFKSDIHARIITYIKVVTQPIRIGRAEFHVHLKAGLAHTKASEANADKLWRQADLAMHEAKAKRQSFAVFHQEMSERYVRRFEMSKRLQRAISLGELELHYQPQFDADRNYCGVEVLCRWYDDIFGQVSPCEFIPLAEERGLIGALTEAVVEKLLQQMIAWRDQGLHIPHRFAINLSVQDLERPQLLQWIKQKVAVTGLGAERFELEITETALMQNPEQAIDTCRELQELGFRIAIDDFGVGHSSLNYLKKMRADLLKIDMSFTREMLNNPSDHAIVKTIIATADIFGMETLAEGVESEAQAAELKRLGCHYLQGYLLAKPMPASEFTAFIRAL